jgi:hypothetical protein
MVFNKKGKQSIGVIALEVILGLFLLVFILLTVFNQGDYSSSLDALKNFFVQVLQPLFNFLLNLDGTNDFLMVISFILMIIIVTGVLDAANLFGGSDSQNNVLNLVLGVIISIIGIRFMPSDVWGSLTAPSSALVASVLMGLPFLAIFLIGMKMKSVPARKVLWMFYFIFTSYLVFRRPENYGTGSGAFFQGFAWIYLIFVLASLLMLLFDGQVRALINREKGKVEMEKVLSDLDVKERYNLRKEAEAHRKIFADPTASKRDRKIAEDKIKDLEKIYGDLSSI